MNWLLVLEVALGMVLGGILMTTLGFIFMKPMSKFIYKKSMQISEQLLEEDE